jgi:hypothetical protein
VKVSELIEQLKDYDKDAEVLLASDEEGSSFSELEDVAEYMVTRYESVKYEIDNEEGEALALVLWP